MSDSTSRRYTKRPVTIETMQWDGTADGAGAVVEWIQAGGGNASYICLDRDRCADHEGDSPHVIDVRTLEGTMSAGLGWWIIRGIIGEFYPCDPGVFTASYAEAVDEDAAALAEAYHRLAAAAEWNDDHGDASAATAALIADAFTVAGLPPALVDPERVHTIRERAERMP